MSGGTLHFLYYCKRMFEQTMVFLDEAIEDEERAQEIQKRRKGDVNE